MFSTILLPINIASLHLEIRANELIELNREDERLFFIKQGINLQRWFTASNIYRVVWVKWQHLTSIRNGLKVKIALKEWQRSIEIFSKP